MTPKEFAVGIGIGVTVVFALASILYGCTPTTPVPAPPPMDVTVVYPGADGPCVRLLEIADARLIRLSDGGSYQAPSECGTSYPGP